MEAVQSIVPELGVRMGCQVLGLPRSSYYRALKPKRERAERKSPRALTQEERETVRQVLNEARFQDFAPREVYASLLDEGQYLCHWRSMYRILQANREVRERRNQLRHPHYQKPELLATRPNYGVGILLDY